MPIKTLVKMLDQGKTGDEILTILDMITADDSDSAEPTLDEIQF